MKDEKRTSEEEELLQQEFFRKQAKKNIGQGTEHDKKNADLLARLRPTGRTTYKHVTQMLNATLNDISVAADELSTMTGLSPYLARIYIATQYKESLEGMIQWLTARSIANFESKTNTATALGMKPTTLSNKMKHINPIVSAILQAQRENTEINIDLNNRSFTIYPHDEFHLDPEKETQEGIDAYTAPAE